MLFTNHWPIIYKLKLESTNSIQLKDFNIKNIKRWREIEVTDA